MARVGVGDGGHQTDIGQVGIDGERRREHWLERGDETLCLHLESVETRLHQASTGWPSSDEVETRESRVGACKHVVSEWPRRWLRRRGTRRAAREQRITGGGGSRLARANVKRTLWQWLRGGDDCRHGDGGEHEVRRLRRRFWRRSWTRRVIFDEARRLGKANGSVACAAITTARHRQR